MTLSKSILVPSINWTPVDVNCWIEGTSWIRGSLWRRGRRGDKEEQITVFAWSMSWFPISVPDALFPISRTRLFLKSEGRR